MADKFNIRVEGLDTTLNKLAKLAQQNKTEAKQAITETAINIERKAKQNLAALPFKDSVGGIAQSGYILYDGDGYGGEVGFNKFTSPYIEYGTGNQVVVPIGWEDFALQFKKGDGVNIKPMPYFHPAINSELENLKRNLKNSMKP
ncbi:hypothetical protein [Pedobacter cryoconitis]|uniref:HK97 gp10 family phage protein n=1 Tax=Pedobacter cryoconitis TaxID=188932 RepID=A0A327SGX1_9SPHI|nr:hypothetical protein [Pedobacter cryoconitis]RAJ24997.1 hypothetical protein LY11_04184 [Pedobacter cryoconitis]